MHVIYLYILVRESPHYAAGGAASVHVESR